MQLFVFRRVEQLTENYHREGGMVIVARDRSHAEDLIANDEYIRPTGVEWDGAIVYEVAGDPDARVYVFPDAGCC